MTDKTRQLVDLFAQIRSIPGDPTIIIDPPRDLDPVIIDPMLGTDRADSVEASGGQVMSLAEATAVDGAYDPAEWPPFRAEQVELAALILASIDPSATTRRSRHIARVLCCHEQSLVEDGCGSVGFGLAPEPGKTAASAGHRCGSSSKRERGHDADG